VLDVECYNGVIVWVAVDSAVMVEDVFFLFIFEEYAEVFFLYDGDLFF